METNLLTTNSNINGNVSNCSLSESVTKIERGFAFSPVQDVTHTFTSTCTGEVKSEYTMQEINSDGIFGASIMILLVGLVAAIIQIILTK